MLGRDPKTKATRRIAVIVFLLAVSMVFASALSVESAFGATEAVGNISAHGISAVVLPSDAWPGDVVELRIEMCRESWGRFELEKLDHPQLRMIAEEKIPVSYQRRHYQQRHSLFLQPMSSGEIEIAATEVNISTIDGEETIELPALILNVLPFNSPTLSDSPLPLPLNEATAESRSMFSVLFWIGVAISVLGIWSLVFFAMRNQKSPSKPAESSKASCQARDIIKSLQTGVVPKDELENLLQDSNLSISSELRSKIEQAVYSAQFELGELANLLQEELLA